MDDIGKNINATVWLSLTQTLNVQCYEKLFIVLKKPKF